jgi:hypothetical protein
MNRSKVQNNLQQSNIREVTKDSTKESTAVVVTDVNDFYKNLLDCIEVSETRARTRTHIRI